MNTQQSLFLCKIVSISMFLLVAIFSSVSAQEKQLPAGLISPKAGIICNEQVKVCYDSSGVSIGITKEVMGKQAAEKLTRELSAVDEKVF